MSSTTSFQRARQPEQKQQRRRELLDAAASLLAEGGLDAVSLSAIARRADLSKSNVYRYFESREEILLQLLIADASDWVGQLERELAKLAGSDDVEAVAATLAGTVAQQERMCQLISAVANVLEHNLSVDSIARFKTRVLELTIRGVNALHAALPSLPIDAIPPFLRRMNALIAGLWPMAHPAPLAAEVTEREELRMLACDFEPDLRGALHAMLRGLTATASS